MRKPSTTVTLARATGLHPQTIRRLERRGVIHAIRDYRGWRAFSPDEVERLRQLLGWEVQQDELAPMGGDRSGDQSPKVTAERFRVLDHRKIVRVTRKDREDSP